MRTIKYSHQFVKDWKKAKKTPFACNIQKLMEMVIANPFQTPPSYEKLRGYENTIRAVLMNSIGWFMSLSEIRLNSPAVGAITSKKQI